MAMAKRRYIFLNIIKLKTVKNTKYKGINLRKKKTERVFL